METHCSKMFTSVKDKIKDGRKPHRHRSHRQISNNYQLVNPNQVILYGGRLAKKTKVFCNKNTSSEAEVSTLQKQFCKFTEYNVNNFVTNVKLCNFQNYNRYLICNH